MNLRELLLQYQERTGASYRTIAETCDLSHAKVGQLMAVPLKHRPHPATLDAVADGLKIPSSTVRRAALVSMGEDGGSRRDQMTDLIYNHLDQLGDDTLVMAEAVIAAMVKVERGA